MFMVIIIMASSTGGCIDKGILDGIVELVEGDDGSGYVWQPLLERNGIFLIEPSDDDEIDPVRLTTKVLQNLTNSDPTQIASNMRKIMNEENLTMRKYIFPFIVVEETRNVNIQLIGIFKTSLGNNAPNAGYMELTIINPEGDKRLEPITQLQERQQYTYAQVPIPGKWTIELQGIGLQPPLNLIYSGEWSIAVRAESPRVG